MYSLSSFHFFNLCSLFICILRESFEFPLHIVPSIFCHSFLLFTVWFWYCYCVFSLTALLYPSAMLSSQKPESCLKPCCPLCLPLVYQQLQFLPPKYFFKLSNYIHLYCHPSVQATIILSLN